MGKSYLCAVFKALLEFLGRKPNTSALYYSWPDSSFRQQETYIRGKGNITA